jgi:N-acylneuraminate cytidylyltransferase
MSTICIIPARGGSKRIPGKNIRLFAGLPMIAHSIRAAQEAGVFDRILVSTDSDEIASVARQFGAETPFVRPAELAGDFIGTDAVNVHALGWLAEQGEKVGAFCCVYATAPFLRARFLQRGLELLRQHHAVSALSVATFSGTIFRSLRLNAEGRIEMFWPENFPKRSQDFPAAYHDAGQFYWFDAARYLRAPRMIMDGAVPVIIPRSYVQDIDTPEDWEVAELMWRVLLAREAQDFGPVPA